MNKPAYSQRKWLLNNGLYLAFVVALVATLGSLYFSEIREFVPCVMCWYQRILMYPLTVLLAIAAVRKDYTIVYYIVPLTVMGMLLSSYHYLTQKVPYFHHNTGFCGSTPCNEIYVNYFGFVTIPFLSLTAFILVTILLILTYYASRAHI